MRVAPTTAKFLSRSSAKIESVDERRCFLFFGGSAPNADAAGVEVEAAGAGLMRAASTSTCARYSGGQRLSASERKTRTLQFLIPITSSTSPSYVSCVQSGVTMSTCRSITIIESMQPTPSGVAPAADSGISFRSRSRSSLNRCKRDISTRFSTLAIAKTHFG